MKTIKDQRRNHRARLNGDGAAVPETPFRRAQLQFLDCGPEIVMALRTGHSAFQDVVLAFFFGREPHPGDLPLRVNEQDRLMLRRSFGVVLSNFEAEHGRILRSYFASNYLAAAALTEHDVIEVVLARDVPSSELIQIIRRAQALGYLAWHRLERYDRSLCQRMIFAVILELLRRLDQTRQDGGTASRPLTSSELAALRRNLDEAEDFMLRCATRRAQSEYVHGMLKWGSLLLIPVLIAAVVTALLNDGSFAGTLGQALLASIAGAVGAMVSVMWRMTSGTFSINLPTLDYASARSELRLMGAGRPAIGGIFALAVFVFALSPLLPIDAVSKHDTYFLLALGFLAGFSERFAQDMFVRSGQGLAGPGGDSPSTGLSAGLAPPPAGRRSSQRTD
jgi:hypothetical protein